MRKSILAGAMFLAAAALPAGGASATEFISQVIMSGLNNPRGLAFAPDGSLYVTEAGVLTTGGPTTNARGLTFHFSNTGSITRYANGSHERILTGLPSIAAGNGSDTSGPSDIAFGADGTGYVVFGFVTDPNVRSTELGPGGSSLGQVFTLTGSSLTQLADVAAYEGANNPAGRELNSNPFKVTTLVDGLLVTDAGSNTLLYVAPDGSVTPLATFLARDMGAGFPSDSVPTGLAVGPDGNYYVAELTGFPFVQGAANIYRITPTGVVSIAFTGFTNITDIAFGPDGALYVLQADSNGLATPGGGGALIRVAMDGTRQTVFNQGLVVPTGLAIGADNAFYVTNFSVGAGIGQVLRISAVPEPGTWAMMILGFGAVGIAMRRQRRVALAV